LHIETRHRTTAIGRCQCDAGVSNRVLNRDVAIRDVQNVAVVRLEIRNEHISAATGLTNWLVAREGTDAFDARHTNQREALLDRPGRVAPAADAHEASHGPQRGRDFATYRLLPNLITTVLPLKACDAGRDAGSTILHVHLIPVARSHRQRLLGIERHPVPA